MRKLIHLKTPKQKGSRTMAKRLTSVLLIALMVSSISVLVPSALSAAPLASSDWTLVRDSVAVQGFPDLRLSTWQKNANMAPNGPYDKIGLERLAKVGTTYKGVVFFVYGLNGASGESNLAKPSTDTSVMTEEFYWATNGYEIYSIDYRTHFVPSNLNASQLGFMQNWGWDQWISDVKESINKAKEISGTPKVFLAGFATGGEVAVNYATLYGQDLRGLILLDTSLYQTQGANLVVKRGGETNSYNLTQELNTMNQYVNWSAEQTSAAAFSYALQYPNATVDITGKPLSPPVNPYTGKPIVNITDYWTFVFQYLGFSNPALGNVTRSLQGMTSFDRYYPQRLKLESLAMADWTNCPYVTNDFDDNYLKIDVPTIVYSSSLYTNSTGKFKFVNSLGTNDFTTVMLPRYGLFDVHVSANATKDISQPIMNWMMNHYQPPAASTFSSVTVYAGQTWYFYVNSNGGVSPHKYQWYEGNTLLPGQTGMVIAASKATPGTYTYYCKVTDAEGSTVSSSPVTLTVSG